MSLHDNEDFMDDADPETLSSGRNSTSSSHQGHLRASVSQSRVDVARAIGNHFIDQMNESRYGSSSDTSVKRIESVRLLLVIIGWDLCLAVIGYVFH
jgi:hypothetical protein